MDEVEKILKDNNYFTNLEKRIEEYNNKMMAVYNNEATEYINRVDKAIIFIHKRIDELKEDHLPIEFIKPDIIEILHILIGE